MRDVRVQWRNGIAEAGCVIAVIAVALALVPVIGVVAWLLAPIGLVLSFAGFVDACCHRGIGLVVSLCGMTIGVMGLLVCLIQAVAHHVV